jgi:hypothetical protein
LQIVSGRDFPSSSRLRLRPSGLATNRLISRKELPLDSSDCLLDRSFWRLLERWALTKERVLDQDRLVSSERFSQDFDAQSTWQRPFHLKLDRSDDLSDLDALPSLEAERRAPEVSKLKWFALVRPAQSPFRERS